MVGREEEAFLGFDNTQYTPKVQAAGLGEERERERERERESQRESETNTYVKRKSAN